MEKHYVMKTSKEAIVKAKEILRKEMGRRLFSLVVIENRMSYCTCGQTNGKNVATWNKTKYFSKTIAVCENCYNDWQD